jgi:hypothetical protein
MKALGKLLGELMAWRWAPAVGLCVASLFYVLVVVALVPDEIGVPVTNARFAKKLAPSEETPEAPTYPTAVSEVEAAAPPPVAAVQPAGVVDFGRRGFSPPIDRPEPPPPPPPPVAPPPPVVPEPAVAVAPPAAEAAAIVAAPAPGAMQVEGASNVAGAPGVAPNGAPGMNPAVQALRRFPFARGLNPQLRQPPGAQPPGAQPPGAQPPGAEVPAVPPPTPPAP